MFYKLSSKRPSLSYIGSHMMISDSKNKNLGVCADLMRLLMGIFTEQKFFRQTSSIVLVKSLLFIEIFKMSKSFIFNACSDNRIKALGLCRNQIRYFRDIFIEQKFFREPRSIIWVNSFMSIPVQRRSKILGFDIISDKKIKTFSASIDQMRHFREMFTEQKFLREQRSIVWVDSFIYHSICYGWNLKPYEKKKKKKKKKKQFPTPNSRHYSRPVGHMSTIYEFCPVKAWFFPIPLD